MGAVQTVADGYRQALAVAGIDPTPLGVRDSGPLNWTPPARIDRREPPVAVARRRIIARQRLAALELERRRRRIGDRYWTGAA